MNKTNHPIKHGFSMSGKRHPLYAVWAAMRNRCRNPNDKGFKNYGGRGITVCKEWEDSFVPFVEWALINGYASGLCLDRIDNEKGYAPQNCRWTTRTINNRNNRRNVHVEAFGETKLLWDWFKDSRCLVRWNTVYQRLRNGLDYKAALFTAPTPRNMRRTVDLH